MKKIRKYGALYRCIAAALLIASFCTIPGNNPVNSAEDPIIADHKAVEQFDNIPQVYINAVKEMFLNVPGESHSAGYRNGLVLLAQQYPEYAVTNYGDDQPSAGDGTSLRISRWVYSNPRGSSTGEQEWFTWHAYDDPSQEPDGNAYVLKNHITFCNSSDIPISALGFGWCWDMTMSNFPGGEEDPEYHVRWAGSSVGGPDGNRIWGLDDDDKDLTENRVNMNGYLEATEEYIDAAGPDTAVFFTTGPVDNEAYIGENGYQRYLKHEYIRQYVINNGKVLFDYADILSWNDAGVLNQVSWDGYDYPFIHPDNLKDLDGSENDEDMDHIGEVGAIRLGKAIWWMLARLAGWDGAMTDTEAPMVTVINPNGGEICKAGYRYEIAWQAEDNNGVTSCNLSYSIDNGLSFVTIITGIENTGTYLWTIPRQISDLCLLQVTAVDASGNWSYDVSNSAFSISGSLPGDANDDFTVNALDIIYTELILLGQAQYPALPHDADSNGDGFIDILDIVETETNILSP